MDNSENIFVQRHQSIEEHYIKWGLGDLDSSAQVNIRMEADNIIRRNRVTDDTEKQKVYDDVKEQYFAYEASKQVERDNDTKDTKQHKEAPIEIDENEEYQRGYNACIAYEKEQEERSQAPY